MLYNKRLSWMKQLRKEKILYNYNYKKNAKGKENEASIILNIIFIEQIFICY